jgi:hypothetical protein
MTISLIMMRGAQLAITESPDLEVTWWRERDREVDFVLSGPAADLVAGR